jgi:hypothetical protein
MAIRLSPKQAEDLRQISYLSSADIDAIATNTLSFQGDLTEPSSLRAIIENSVNLDPDQLKSVSLAVGGLFYLLLESAQSVNDLVNAIAEASSEIGLTVPEITNLCKNLGALFGIRKLFEVHKAEHLAHQKERLLSQARILTDVRPVFADSLEDGILGYVITHTLKLSFFDTQGDHEFFVSVDESDLLSIKASIERAIEKQALIKERSGLSSANFLTN